MVKINARTISAVEERLDLPLVDPEQLIVGEYELDERDVRSELVQYIGQLPVAQESKKTQLLSQSERTHFQFLYNLESYIGEHRTGAVESKLRDHQHDVFEDIFKFLAEPVIDSVGNMQRRGYIELPTGSGKTAIFSTLVNVLSRSLPNTDKKLKALVLVPNLDLVSQTVGKDGQRGFSQFAPDMNVTEYHGLKKDLSGDTVVMSYQSLTRAVEQGVITKQDFDLVICDEAHRALGDKTRKALEEIADDKLLLGLTASPEFKKRHVNSLFVEKVHSLDLRETIEMGLLNSVRCFAITSEEEIETLKYGEFSDEELAGLIENEWRNQKAVQFTKAFVEHGQSGIISCIPGQNTKHAADMAHAISQELVLDKSTAELRRIKAMAVSGNSKDRQAIYDAFERGEIDVLTYVDVLTEGWDSTRAKFLINLRPTTSPVSAIQRLGRILRKSEDSTEVATVIEFIDKTNKPLYTFFHVMGEKTIEQGYTISKIDSLSDSESKFKKSGLEEPNELNIPDEISEKLASINHVTLDQLIVENAPLAFDGTKSISDFAQEVGASYSTVMKRAKELDIYVARYKFSSGPSHGLTDEQQRILLEGDYFNVPEAAGDVMSIADFADKLKVSFGTMQRLIEELEIQPSRYRFSNAKRYAGLNLKEQKILLEHPYLSTPIASADVISLSALAQEINVAAPTLERIAEETGIVLGEYRFIGTIGLGLTSKQKKELLSHTYFEAKPAPVEIRSLRQFAAELGSTAETISKLAKDMGLDLDTYLFNSQLSFGLTPEQREIISSHSYFSVKQAPEDVMSVAQFAKEIGSTPDTVQAQIDAIGLDLSQYRFGRKVGNGLSSEQASMLRTHPVFNIKKAPEGVKSVRSFSKEIKSSPGMVVGVAEELNIEVGEYKFNGRISNGLTPDEQEKVAIAIAERRAASQSHD